MLLALFLCSAIPYDHFLNYLISSYKIIAPMALSSLLFPEYTGTPFLRLSCLLSLSLPDPLCLTQYSKGTPSERPSQAGGNGMPYPHPHIFLSSASCSRHHQLTSYCLSGIVFISTPGEWLAPFCPLLGLQHLELCLEYSVPNFLPCEECLGCDLAALIQICLDGKGHH